MGNKSKVYVSRLPPAWTESLLREHFGSCFGTVSEAEVFTSRSNKHRPNFTKRGVGHACFAFKNEGKCDRGDSCLFSHDLSTVASFADHVVVLYAGRVVEQGPLASVLAPPFHPYTRLLLSSVPELRTDWLDGVVASKAHLDHLGQAVDSSKVGCPFFNRCAVAVNDVCNRRDVPLRQMAQSHTVACHLELDALRE